MSETLPEQDLVTPEPRPLDGLFTPDAPHGSLTKTITTQFVTDYGENVPESAHELVYTGPSVIAWVVKTSVPSYLLQMPKDVRTRIYNVATSFCLPYSSKF